MECLLNPDDFYNLFYLRRWLLLSYDAFNQLQDLYYMYIERINRQIKIKIRTNDHFYMHSFNKYVIGEKLNNHVSIESNVLFICSVKLNEHTMLKRNSIFQALACSHLEFNRIIGNDNDIYIDAVVSLYSNSQ